jgi:cation diffusion facilitator CzcD-associated flavoprotein CzcO
MAESLSRRLPPRTVYSLIRWKNVVRMVFAYQLSRRAPRVMKKILRTMVSKQLPADFDIDTHMTPTYNPWDQRLCFVPDGDLFRALRRGNASIVTDQIDCFTETGIRLASGQDLDADVIVTATGLNLQVLGDIDIERDGANVDLTSLMAYKGMMLSDLPNFIFGVGYTNASWTLKIDLTYDFLTRLLRFMDRRGYTTCVPRRRDPSVTERPFMDFSPGYVLRSIHLFPKQGSKEPWRLRMNYLIDALTVRLGRVDDGVLEFGAGVSAPVRTPQPAR